MIELLLVMSVVVFVTSLMSHHHLFEGFHHGAKGILTKQVEAMYNLRRSHITKDMWFNANGNINQANTIIYNNMRCTIQLGFGRYRCV